MSATRAPRRKAPPKAVSDLRTKADLLAAEKDARARARKAGRRPKDELVALWNECLQSKVPEVSLEAAVSLMDTLGLPSEEVTRTVDSTGRVLSETTRRLTLAQRRARDRERDEQLDHLAGVLENRGRA